MTMPPPPARGSRRKLDLPAPVDPARVAAFLPGVSPPGTTIQPKHNGWLLRLGNRVLRIHLDKGGTRLRFTMQTPWWAYFFILLGLLPFIIAVIVFDVAVKSFATDIRGRLASALGVPGHPPRPFSPCPFCHNLVEPTANAAGQRICPVCGNTGRPLPPPPQGMGTGAIVAIVLGGVFALFVMAAVVFALVSNLGDGDGGVYVQDTVTLKPGEYLAQGFPVGSGAAYRFEATSTDGAPFHASLRAVDDWIDPDPLPGDALWEDYGAELAMTYTFDPGDYALVIACEEAVDCEVHYVIRRLE